MEIFAGSTLEGETEIPEGHSDVARAAEADRKKMLWFRSNFDDMRSPELSAAEVVGIRSDMVKRIFDHYGLLGDALDRHESKLHTRWLNKRTAQRGDIILKAWGGDMALPHRPDWDFTQNGKYGSRGHCTYEEYEAMICPQANQEDLAKP
jgi:hypothetical protein